MEIENGRKTDYNVHNLTFLRNNSYPQKITFDKEQNYFFMMDYYNLLKEKKLKKETDGYMTLVGGATDENNAVAKRTMGIYSKHSSGDEQIFQTAAAEKGFTSESPFLGIIQVYIADYKWKKDDSSVYTQKIDSYLKSYEKEIEEKIRPILAKDDIYHIYRTITSEDFCVIIRTSKISNIYHSALKIMDIRNSNKRVFFTYTNIGIECVKCKEDEDSFSGLAFSGLNESVRVKNQDVSFVLRFRIENKALEDIQALEFQQNKKDVDARQVKIEDVNGMIGRYDLVVRLSMDEFMEVYPHLCMNVMGDKFKALNSDHFKGHLSKILVEKMAGGVIQAINTRIIIDIYPKEKNEKKQEISLLDEVDIHKIKSRTDQVMDLYKEFKANHNNKFSADKYRYVELNRMLDTLIYSYQNLAYEIDTHINWFICSQYLEIFFQNMNSYMDTLDEHIEPEAIGKFLNEFQAFISAFDIYLRLLQGINQNTIQSPRYDISAPIDGQKFLMAYSEFIDSIHEEYRMDAWGNKEKLVCREKRRIEKTIIYPDLTIKNLELMEVFHYDNKIKEEDPEEQEETENTAILICKIPMFEYFERPYDLIPLILHEICHHMLILDRSIRNEFLIKRVFERIAAEAVKQVQSRYVKKEYGNKVDALTKIMEESLADALIETFKENCIPYKKYVFLHLVQRIQSFVYSYFEDEEQKQNNRSGSYSVKELTEQFETLISELYEEDEKALKEFRSIDISIIIKSDDPEAIYDCNTKLISFAKELLQQINEKTINYSKPMILNNLWGINNKELDEYLHQWAKENESDILNAEEEKAVERKQLLKYYLELTKRTFILLTEAVSMQKDRAGSFRKKLAENFEKKANEQLKKFMDEYYYIYDQDKMKKIAFWELGQEGMAEKHFIEAMECIDSGKIMGTIKFSYTNYREVCADIIMCKWLGLGSFGYFRKAIALAPRMQGGFAEQIQYGSMQWERLVTVLSVLVTVENSGSNTESEIKEIDLSCLQKNIWQYIEETLNCTKDRIGAAMDADKTLDDKRRAKIALHKFFERIEHNIQILEESVLENKKIVWEDSVLDCLYKRKLNVDNIDEYFKYFYKEANIFKRLYDMLETYNCIQIHNKVHIKSDVYNHTLNVYRNATNAHHLHKVVKEVADFYNDPTSEKKTNMQKLTDMLLFVQDYYYCNRIKKAEVD